MKKLIALILIALTLTTIAAPAFAKTIYDPEKIQLVITARDEKTGETYITVVNVKTALNRIEKGLVYQVYLLASEGLEPAEIVTKEDGSVAIVLATGMELTK